MFAVPASGLRDAAAHRVEVVCSDPAGAELLAAAAGDGAPLRVHLEVETGLSRAGLLPETVGSVGRRLREAGATLAGVWSHLASPEDADASAAQVARFEVAVQALMAAGIPVPARHLSASGGIFTDAPDFELVRPGLCLYGELGPELVLDEARQSAAAELRPAMSLKARPVRVETLPEGTGVGYGSTWRAPATARIATLPVGYGDGYDRAYARGGAALVRGVRVPLVGTVAMDAIMVDVTGVPGAPVDQADEFVLLGEQDGQRIEARELARLRTTNPWEVLASMAWRVPRVYHASAGSTGLRTLAGEHLAR
jgi:alanine racemase